MLKLKNNMAGNHQKKRITLYMLLINWASLHWLGISLQISQVIDCGRKVFLPKWGRERRLGFRKTLPSKMKKKSLRKKIPSNHLPQAIRACTRYIISHSETALCLIPSCYFNSSDFLVRVEFGYFISKAFEQIDWKSNH